MTHNHPMEMGRWVTQAEWVASQQRIGELAAACAEMREFIREREKSFIGPDAWLCRACGRKDFEAHVDVCPVAKALASDAGKGLLARLERYEKALREITEGKGHFSLDPLTHAHNTIDDMVCLARAALEE